MNWHTRLTQARTAKGIGKSAFAKLVGVSAPTITQWENGDTKKIEGSNLVTVCRVLGITPEWLLSGIGLAAARNQAPPDQNQVEQDFCAEAHLQWVRVNEAQLLDYFRGTDERGRDSMLRYGKKLPVDLNSNISGNKPQ
jgi:transcriptional regulator with XRE-family HTH domain